MGNVKHLSFHKDPDGLLQLTILALEDWDDYERLIKFVMIYYKAIVLSNTDGIWWRECTLKIGSCQLSLIHNDGSNYFLSSEESDEPLLYEIGADLERRFKNSEFNIPKKRYIFLRTKRLLFNYFFKVKNYFFKKVNFFDLELDWYRSGNPEFPYTVNYNNYTLQIKINDLPNKPMFTLMKDGQELKDFEVFPKNWHRKYYTNEAWKTFL